MKLKLLLSLTCAFIIIIFFFACRKDSRSMPQNEKLDPFLVLAKEQYYKTKSETSKLQSFSDSSAKPAANLRPLWTRSYVSKTSGYELAEIPVRVNKQEIALYNNLTNTPVTKEDQLAIVNASFKRLVIFRTKEGSFKQRLVTYIPDPEYLKKHQYDASGNYITKLQKDFSGYMEYSELSGKRLFVLRIVNGKKVKAYRLETVNTGKAVSQPKKGIKTLDYACFEVCSPTYSRVCLYGGDPEVEACTDWEEAGNNCQTVCIFIPDADPVPPGGGGTEPGDEGGESGGGWQPDPQPDPQTPPPAEVKDSLDNPCLKAVLTSLINKNLKNDITNLINNTFNVNDNIHLEYKESLVFPTNKLGQTSISLNDVSNGVRNFAAVIQLNSNVLSGSSQEYIAATMIHEALHAYFQYDNLLYDNGVGQHLLMAINYVDDMRNCLKEVFPNLSNNDANALIINGFSQIQSYQPANFDEILDHYNLSLDDVVSIRDDYQNGTTGTNCSN